MDDKARDADLNTAIALTQRLLGSSDDSVEPAKPGFGQNLRYWLWKAGARRLTQAKNAEQVSKLLDNYDMELERLRQNHDRDLAAQKQAHDLIVQEIEAAHLQSFGSMRAGIMAEAEAASQNLRQDLERERQRVTQLEQLTAELERVYRAEMAKAQERGQSEGQNALDAAQDRITALEEELAAQASRHQEQLRHYSEEAAKAAETGMAVLRDEIKALNANQAKELSLSRQLYLDQAESESETLRQQVAAAELDKETALRQAQQHHDAALAALRTRHAEELAETRINGEWALGDAKRQITDLRRRLNEQEETHAEATASLREKFEHAAQSLVRAQGRIAELSTELGQTRQAQILDGDRLEGAQARENQLAEQLAAEREARRQLEIQSGSTLADALAAERLASERAQRLQAELETERRVLHEQTGKLEELRAEIQRLRDGTPPPPPPDVAAIIADHNRELARLRLDSSRRIAELERQVAQSESQPQPPPSAEIIPLHKTKPGIDWEARVNDALERAQRAEAEAQLAANKIEVLKDALALAKARPANGNMPAVDHRFRDAKRAFARAFHPDQGGREHPDKAALFLEFWPVLEKSTRKIVNFPAAWPSPAPRPPRRRRPPAPLRCGRRA